METHAVDRVVVTATDHDFVALKVKSLRRVAGRVAAGLALAAVVLAGGAAPASASEPAILTTTFHHPFYDVIGGVYVEAVNLPVGDHLQTANGGEASVVEATPYQSTEDTYDLTIDSLHTYYVFAGVVHSCNEELRWELWASANSMPIVCRRVWVTARSCRARSNHWQDLHRSQ